MDVSDGRVGNIAVPTKCVLTRANARAWQRFARAQLESRGLGAAIKISPPVQVASWLTQSPSLLATNPRASRVTVGETAVSQAPGHTGGSEHVGFNPATPPPVRDLLPELVPPRAPSVTPVAPSLAPTTLDANPIAAGQALGLLKLMIPLDLAPQFDDCGSAQEVWDLVDEWAIQYDTSQPWVITTELSSLSLEEGERIASFMYRGRELFKRQAQIGIVVSEDVAVRQLLNRLIVSDMERFRQASYDFAGRHLTLRFVDTLIRLEDLDAAWQQAAVTSTKALIAPVIPKGKPVCEECGKSGHSKATCYKLIGYPSDSKQKQKSKSRSGNAQLRKELQAVKAQLAKLTGS